MRFFEKVPVRVASMVQNSAEYFLIEIKPLFSIILTHLGPDGGTYPHSHPFKAFTIMLKGRIDEYNAADTRIGCYKAFGMKFTGKGIHSIFTGEAGAWFLTFRGPWTQDTWQEVRGDKTVTLTHGRKEVE